MERTDSHERAAGPPRLNLAGNKPSWREREAAKKAAEANGGAAAGGAQGNAPAPPAPAPTETLKPSGAAGKYVPRHLREKQVAMFAPDGWAALENKATHIRARAWS
ncbi:hypothetical protein DL768_007784 [Monosporascus sp. mg162]|nr:hypothetical protein DL768_007784 [Monosporascus sp. mg162]